MGTLKLISVLSLIFIITACSDKIKSIDTENFSYIDVINYKGEGKKAQLIFYKKKSNFNIKLIEYSDFTLNFIPVNNSLVKALSMQLNFDNKKSLECDLELIIDSKYYYRFTDINTQNDTLKRPNVIRNDLYIYKTLSSKVNDSLMIFKHYEIRKPKTLILPFSLANQI